MNHEARAQVGGWVIEFLTKVGRTDLLDVVRVEWKSRFTARMGDATYVPVTDIWDIRLKRPPKTVLVRFSIPLWERAGEVEQRNTVAHELAHVVCFHEWYLGFRELPGRGRKLPGRGRKPKAHGWEWKAIMRRMGETPSRCHNVDRTGLVQRRSTRVHAHCDCRAWELTPRKATKIDRLYCPKCKVGLSLGRAA